MLNLNNSKKKRAIAGIIALVLVGAMVVSLLLAVIV